MAVRVVEDVVVVVVVDVVEVVVVVVLVVVWWGQIQVQAVEIFESEFVEH